MTDALEKLKMIRDEHRIVSIGGDLEDAARRLSRAVKGMGEQVRDFNFDLTEPERRKDLSETLTPYVKNREEDIQAAWNDLKNAFEKYDNERTRTE